MRNKSTIKTNIRNRRRVGNNWYGKGGKRERAVRILNDSQKGLCAICKGPILGRETVDHIIPIAEGGTNFIQNMQLLCEPCHVEKDKPTCTKFGSIGLIKKYGKNN